MHTALLIMVHGSPRPEANADMFRVADLVRERRVFDLVEVGFMECNAPDIPTAIQTCIEQGAARIVAVPYFLHTGTHVADDLPGLLEDAQAHHPHVEFAMGRYLGASPRLTAILAARAQATHI
jgi:sirohydrochlorin ferrochelatase